MAKSKSDLLDQAKASGAVAADAVEDDYTADDLKALVSGDEVVKDRVSASEPIIAADGHVVLSQEDIDARG
jgi:hypothetical protein